MRKLILLGLSIFGIAFTLPTQGQETIQKPAKQLYGHDKDVSSLAVSPDGQYLVSGSWKNKIILWSLDSFDQLWQVNAHESTVEKLDFGPDSRYFVSCSNDADAYIWDAEEQTKSLTLPGHRSNIRDVKFNDNYEGNEGRFVATATKAGIVRVFDREKDAKIIRKIKLKNTTADAICFGPSGRYINIAGGDNVIRVYNFLQDKQARKFNAHSDQINVLKLSPSGMNLLTASNDQTAKIWNYAKGRNKTTLKGHTWKVLAADFSSNGDYVITGSNDNSARLWNASKGKTIRVFKPKGRDYFRGVAITPDNQYVITASLVRKEKDAGILIWETGLSDAE